MLAALSCMASLCSRHLRPAWVTHEWWGCGLSVLQFLTTPQAYSHEGATTMTVSCRISGLAVGLLLTFARAHIVHAVVENSLQPTDAAW